MKIEPLAIPEVLLITPPRFADARGFFSETWVQSKLEAQGFSQRFVQDNHSYSAGYRHHSGAALPGGSEHTGKIGAGCAWLGLGCRR